MMMAIWKFAPALAAGNTVVLKPSDTTPVSTLLLAEIAAEFLPPGVFNVICGDRRHRPGAGRPRHPADGVDHRLGPRGHRQVARAAAAAGSSGCTWNSAARRRSSSSMTPTSAPAAEGIAAAGYFNAGQDCTAATRVLAGPGIAADLTDALAEQAAAPRSAASTCRTPTTAR